MCKENDPDPCSCSSLQQNMLEKSKWKAIRLYLSSIAECSICIGEFETLFFNKRKFGFFAEEIINQTCVPIAIQDTVRMVQIKMLAHSGTSWLVQKNAQPYGAISILLDLISVCVVCPGVCSQWHDTTSLLMCLLLLLLHRVGFSILNLDLRVI